MKVQIYLLLLLLPVAAAAQSSPPPCPLTGVKHNCHGSHTFANGDRYIGEFKGNKFSGQGEYFYSHGTRYVGEFKDDRFHGQGTYTSAGGSKYVGEFKDGNRNGQGTQTTPDRKRYVGEWRDDKRNGQGIEYQANGNISRSGLWADGNLIQSFAIDLGRFPFSTPIKLAGSSTSQVIGDAKKDEALSNVLSQVPINTPTQITGSATTNALVDRMAAEAQTARQRQQELEQRLAAQAAETEIAKLRQQELEAQLVSIQSQGTTRPLNQMAVIRNAHALVIGNNAYPGSMRLLNAVNDANAISQKLRSLGFSVTVLTDLNRQRLVQALTQFRRSAGTADLSLLFYSGHGVQIFGTNYILPTDVDQSDLAQATIQGVSLNSVLENFLPGKTKLVFLDACRDNPLMRSGDRSVSTGLAPISAAQGTLISYATKDGQTASDGAGARNSPFTQALLQHLGDPTDIAVVLRKVREKVMQATGGKQQPWEYGSLTGGELVLSAVRKTAQ